MANIKGEKLGHFLNNSLNPTTHQLTTSVAMATVSTAMAMTITVPAPQWQWRQWFWVWYSPFSKSVEKRSITLAWFKQTKPSWLGLLIFARAFAVGEHCPPPFSLKRFLLNNQALSNVYSGCHQFWQVSQILPLLPEFLGLHHHWNQSQRKINLHSLFLYH